MPRWKDISKDLKAAAVAAHQLEKVYKVISKLSSVHHPTERKIFPKRKTSQTAACLEIPAHSAQRQSAKRNGQKPKSSILDSTGLISRPKVITLNQYGCLEGLKEKASSL
ncbi:hypothetical protein ATANTOWER_006934 [Ataeniobius toweri]|uniref:Uncharacterized protein n=1 Tax=Ataeniobius toweri TaxID=208326 RepID=A0ABU7B7W3_9TELE|nr:hypothetical protein [Ataeniobius toweri]